MVDPRFLVLQQSVVQSHQNYHIEYGPRLSNHLIHGLVTLFLLGASEKRIQEWAEKYSKHEVIGYHLEPQKDTDLGVTITMNNFIDYLGKRKNYRELFYCCLAKIEAHGIAEAVNAILPITSAGIAGALLHPIIHLGFSLAAGDLKIAQAEGLAYTIYAYEPLVEFHLPQFRSKLPDTSCSATEIFRKIEQDNELFNAYRIEELSSNPADRYNTIKQKQYQTKLLEFLGQWDILHMPSESAQQHKAQYEAGAEALARLSVQLFGCCSKPSADFFLLHGVTGAFGMITSAKYLELHSYRLQLLAYGFYILSCLYVIVGCPTFQDESPVEDPPMSWEDMIQQIVVEDSDDNEPHVMKMVLVCQRFEQMFGGDDDLWRKTATALVNLKIKDDLSRYSSRVGVELHPDPR